MDIRFTALKFSAPRNITFKYRLDGLDREWIDAGRERVAHFSHLAPGEYRFRVKACNNDGIWNVSDRRIHASGCADFLIKKVRMSWPAT